MADVAASIVELFKKFDSNGDGVISKDELKRVVCAISDSFDDAAVDALLAASDANQDGLVQYEEFVNWMTQDMQNAEFDKQAAELTDFTPFDRRGSFQVNYRKLLPERFQVDIKSRYELDQQEMGAAAGGFGKLFTARDTEFPDRHVAVKKVQKPHKSSPAMKDLLKEIDIKKELDHPNISKLLSTFDDGRSMYFIMECCEGGEVLEKIVKYSLDPERTTSTVIPQVAAALGYAHGRGIVHGNIKADNVICCSPDHDDLQIKVIDWMAKAVPSKTYAAPEVMTSQDKKPCAGKDKIPFVPEAADLWSMGVLTYVMLSGTPPFSGTREQHLKAALAERYPFKDEPWDTIKPEAKDFVQNLLKATPGKRLSYQQCLKHPWLATPADKSTTDSVNTVCSNLKNFCAQSTFSRMCITAVARQLDHKHLKDIHAVFREMDVDGNGVLSVEEVTQGMKDMGSEDATKLFATLDMDGSHTIDYTEFCAAALDEKASKQRDVIWAAFKTFDVDNSGFICVDDLTKILDSADVQNTWSAEVCREVGAEIVANFDSRDGDGRIDFEEWEKLMEQCWSKTNKEEKDEDGGMMIHAYDLLKIVS